MKLARKLLVAMLALALLVAVMPAAFAASGAYDDPISAIPDNYENTLVYLEGQQLSTADPYDFSTWLCIEATVDDWFFWDDPEDDPDMGEIKAHIGLEIYDILDAEGGNSILSQVHEVAVSWELSDDMWTYGNITLTPDAGMQIIGHEFSGGTKVKFSLCAFDENGSMLPCYFMIDGTYGGARMMPYNVDMMQSTQFKPTVPRQDTVYYVCNAWGNYQGAVITGPANSTVYMNGIGYTDSDGDGKIEITLVADSAHSMSRIVLGIENNGNPMGAYADTYTVDFSTEPQSECTHANVDTVKAKEVGSCHTNGNIAYKVCKECGEILDMDGNPITLQDTIIPAQNTLYHHPGVANSCTTGGIVEHWYCTVCNSYYADAAETVALEAGDLAIPAHGHHMVYHAPCDPTCQSAGSTGYYLCYNEENLEWCYKYFKDQDGKEELEYDEAVLVADEDPAKRTHPEDTLELVETITPAKCTEEGSGKFHCTCMNPGDTIVLPIPATGHTMVNGVCSVCNLDENPKTGDMGITLAAVVAMVSMGAVLVIGKKKEF